MKFASDELRTVTILTGLPEWQLAWLREHGDRIELAAGEHLFERGQPADCMFIVVKGVIRRYEEIAGQWLGVATTRPGQVTGMLPYSRMTHYPGYTVALESSEVLRLKKEDFQEMLIVSQEIGRRLVSVMTDRVRGDVRLEQQQDRLMALGRLSAGLAHELNNPAAAIRRAAGGLSAGLRSVSPLVLRMIQHGANTEAAEALRELQELAGTRRSIDDSPLELSEREDELGAWLEHHGVGDSWNLAATFAGAGITPDDLETFLTRVPAAIAGEAMSWIANDVAAQRLVEEVSVSASRIADLVASVKTYSQMDRSSEHRPIDVREGLESTLTMLGHQLREKAIQLVCHYQEALPLISANAGELNQVWTNLINNAVDAMNSGGVLTVEAGREDVWLTVRIIDNGCGIAEEMRSRIFEPFFTTKAVGQGIGLGLDIAMRIVSTHRGNIEVQSRPGRTAMCVRLPIPGS